MNCKSLSVFRNKPDFVKDALPVYVVPRSQKVMGNNFMVNNAKTVASIGFQLMKVVKTMNTTFEGMLMNSYFVCLLSSTCTLYSSLTVLFDRSYYQLCLNSAAYFTIAMMTISRLVSVTWRCHNLAESMKKCAHQLDRFLVSKDENDTKETQLLKEELRYHCEAPIAPFSAFSVTTSTFVGTFGTIITYLIVLLQFKVSEKSATDSESNLVTTVSPFNTTSV